ncbi:UNVERIFIED_CONTAM: hypothetical protein GTU68_001245 [Idotea baltica]|nr:hypothetical protein [Idotea baltica]
MPFGIPKNRQAHAIVSYGKLLLKTTPQKPLTLTDVTQYYTLPYNNDSITIATLPGVFSYGRLDKGSALLLNNLTGLPSGHLLDFGCGAGVIGSVLKKHYPSSHITLLDVDAFAVASSHLTLEANELTADVICGDGITSAPAHLNAIITNPPFHQGIHTDYRATEQLLRDASNHLKRQGELRLVANNFLKYAPLIENQIGPCSVLEQKQGFKVYQSILSR